MAKLTTLYHPFIPDNSQEVEEERLAAHLAQGWLKSPPQNAAVKATRAATRAAKKAAAPSVEPAPEPTAE
jgi:hypothetical protein